MKIDSEKLIGIAISYVSDVLARDDFSSPAPDVFFDTSNIERKLSTAAREIKNAIEESTSKIIDKIESDKLEILVSRIQNVALAIRLNDRAEILRSLMVMRESIDYAEHRLREGKNHWRAAFIMGKAANYTALNVCLTDTAQEKTELKAICNQAKCEFLDAIVPQILAQGGQVNWLAVSDFISGNAVDFQTISFSAGSLKALPTNSNECDVVLDDEWWPGYVPNDCSVRVFSIVQKVGDIISGTTGIVVLEVEDGYLDVGLKFLGYEIISYYVKPGDWIGKGSKIARIKRYS